MNLAEWFLTLAKLPLELPAPGNVAARCAHSPGAKSLSI
jgi:hypothetical protein